MINLQTLLKSIMDIEAFCSELGFQTVVSDKYVVCKITPSMELAIIPDALTSIVGMSNERKVFVYKTNDAVASNPNEICYSEITQLKQLKAKVPDDNAWRVIASMIFTVNGNLISEKIKALDSAIIVGNITPTVSEPSQKRAIISHGDNLLTKLKSLVEAFPGFVFTNKNAKDEVVERALYVYPQGMDRRGNVLFEIWHLSTEGQFDIYMKRPLMTEAEYQESLKAWDKTNDSRGRITRRWCCYEELIDFLRPKFNIACGMSDVKVPTKRVDSDEAFTAACLEMVKERLGVQNWTAKKRKIYESPDRTIGLLCLYSKTYTSSKIGPNFWYGYHLEQRDELAKYEKQFIAFCFRDENALVLIPASFVNSQTHLLNKTEKDGKMYWHIRIYEIDGKYYFNVPYKGNQSIEEFAMHGAESARALESPTETTTPASIGHVEPSTEVSLIRIRSTSFKSIKKK